MCHVVSGLELINQCKHTHSHHVSGPVLLILLCLMMLAVYNTRFKCNPPFRSRDQVIVLQRGLSNGWVDHLTALHVPVSGDQYAHFFLMHRLGSQRLIII